MDFSNDESETPYSPEAIQLDFDPNNEESIDGTEERDDGQAIQSPTSLSDLKQKTGGKKGFTSGLKKFSPFSGSSKTNNEVINDETDRGGTIQPQEETLDGGENEESAGNTINQLVVGVSPDVAKQKAAGGKQGFTKSLKKFSPFSGSSPASPTSNEATNDESIDQANPDTSQQNGAVPSSKSWTSGLKKFNPFAGPSQTDENQVINGETAGALSRQTSFLEGSSPTGQQAAGNRNNGQEVELMSSGVFNNKKTLANGLMDFAFLTANANQLHYAIASNNQTPNPNPTTRENSGEKTVTIILISISIGLQIIAGVLFIIGSYIQSRPINELKETNLDPQLVNQRRVRRQRWLNLIDHITIALVFIIAVLNIFIAAFAILPK